jgi:dynein regulatry complex protein 1
MKKQFIDMRTDYTEQLDQIEKAFLRERNDIIQNNETEVKSLLKQQEKLEKEYMTARNR